MRWGTSLVITALLLASVPGFSGTVQDGTSVPVADVGKVDVPPACARLDLDAITFTTTDQGVEAVLEIDDLAPACPVDEDQTIWYQVHSISPDPDENGRSEHVIDQFAVIFEGSGPPLVLHLHSECSAGSDTSACETFYGFEQGVLDMDRSTLTFPLRTPATEIVASASMDRCQRVDGPCSPLPALGDRLPDRGSLAYPS